MKISKIELAFWFHSTRYNKNSKKKQTRRKPGFAIQKGETATNPFGWKILAITPLFGRFCGTATILRVLLSII
jgi:hypothetical protein